MDEECIGCIYGQKDGAVFDCDKGFPPRPCKQRTMKDIGSRRR